MRPILLAASLVAAVPRGGAAQPTGAPPPAGDPPPPTESSPPTAPPAPESPPPTAPTAEAPAPQEDAPPELPPLSNEPGGGDDGAKGDGGFVDRAALDAMARGVIWHGHAQTTAALGVRGAFRGDLVLFENRLQLDLESRIGPLRIIGRPQLVHDGLAEDVSVAFRELYTVREYQKFEISIGERILSWGITDFWPVVDIINPRAFDRLRNWRPIDEKLPAPVLAVSAVVRCVTLQAIGVLLTRSSAFQLDRARPFAIPIAVPDEVPILQRELPDSIRNSGGGVSMSGPLRSWKGSLYALWGRNPLPTVYGRVDLATGAPEIQVENERVAMAAASAQGTVGAIGSLIKTEVAYYRRIDDRCEGAPRIDPDTPSCFYLRRVPTARGTAGIEREVVDGLTAHLQLIAEVTRAADVPRLPALAAQLAPGLVPQHRVVPIATLRLQGLWSRGNFRPNAFVYWSMADRDWFANLDLEYHLADGFAVAVGGFWFEGYDSNPAQNRFTIAGSLESSSHAYLRATAWF